MTSGPNRHFIPAFLQRGFAVSKKVSKSKQEIWIFGSGQRPEQRLIKDTGSGAFFYSDLTDEVITQLESDFARLLSKIRGQAPGDSVSPEEAAALVSHLSMRTAHIRHTGGDLLAQISAEAKKLFSDSNIIAKLVGLDADVPTDDFRNYIVNALAKDPIAKTLDIPPRILERLVFFLLKENPELVRVPSSGLDSLNKALDELHAGSREVIRGSHNKALVEIARQRPSEYEVFLQTLEWKIMDAPKAGAVLPDCVAIALDEDGQADSHMFVDNDVLSAIVMAVAPDKILVGKKSGYVMPTDFEYNVEASRLSHSFFLSSNNNVEMSRPHSILGEQLQTKLDENIAASFDSLRSESVREPTNDESADAIRLETGAPEHLRVSFWDLDDKDEAQRIAVAIAKVVIELVRDFSVAFPIERLDGITIANDYQALMRSMRQEAAWEDMRVTPVPEIPMAGIGIGKTVLINEPDMLKTTIYLPGTVAQALVSCKPDKVAWGTHILAKHLACVAWIGMADKRLPGVLLGTLDCEIDGWLYGNVHMAIKGYTMSRVAAAFGNREEIAHELRHLVVENLNHIETKVLKARRVYRRHGDMEQLLATVLPTIRNVMSYTANLLGHSLSSRESPFDESGVLEDTLKRAGLSTWFGGYQDHLERFHQRFGKWESFEEFLEFNIHAERLLYTVGMCPWETRDGVSIGFLQDSSI